MDIRSLFYEIFYEIKLSVCRAWHSRRHRHRGLAHARILQDLDEQAKTPVHCEIQFVAG